jgi:signal transduction histidine kinase
MPAECEDSSVALARRDDIETIESQYRLVCSRDIPMVLDAIPVISMLLNRHRQMVFGNHKLLTALGLPDIRQALGQRPGEAFRCLHAFESLGGCGTSEFCVHCGAARSILLGLAGHENMRECSMNRERGKDTEALDLLVSSTPVRLDARDFLIVSIIDLSHEKRRRALERIFFHDILNTAGGIQGLMGFLVDEVPPALQEDARLIRQGMEQLTDEIGSQKQLLAAETHELEALRVPLFADEMLTMIGTMFRQMELARGKDIEIQGCPGGLPFVSDPVLLRRVLGNLVKNALEATQPGGRLVLGCSAGASEVTFWVQNAGEIPAAVRARVFSRSFSTKGLGRGLGTYGAKLLTERYLAGSIDFVSNAAEGTVFRVRLPLEPSGVGL